MSFIDTVSEGVGLILAPTATPKFIHSPYVAYNATMTYKCRSKTFLVFGDSTKHSQPIVTVLLDMLIACSVERYGVEMDHMAYVNWAKLACLRKGSPEDMAISRTFHAIRKDKAESVFEQNQDAMAIWKAYHNLAANLREVLGEDYDPALSLALDQHIVAPKDIPTIIEALPEGWGWSYRTVQEVGGRANVWYGIENAYNAAFWVLADHFGRCTHEKSSGGQPEDGMWTLVFLLDGHWMQGKRYGATPQEALAYLKRTYIGKKLIIKAVIGKEL